MPYAYYDRLPPALKAVYNRSDQIHWIRLPEPERVRRHADRLRETLEQEDQPAVRRASAILCKAICEQLQVHHVNVRVLKKRPRDMEGELHGLYIREEGKVPVIRVWMRTAAHKKVVAFRTFLRTLLHELCHHLDYALIRLPDTLHTEGFFRRESSLFDQLVPEKKKRPSGPKKSPQREDKAESKPGPESRQLSLPFADPMN
jgi:hypothetical protein